MLEIEYSITQRISNSFRISSQKENAVAMVSTQLSWIANFIWGIADDVLRDLYTG